MYRETVDIISAVSVKKVDFLNKYTFKYLIASILAGFFVGLGAILMFSISGFVGPAPYTKVFMGASFGIALSLVIMAGSELFTGNNLVMTVGFLDHKIKIKDILKLWIVCYIGHFVGAALVSLFYVMTQFPALAGADVATNSVAMAFMNTAHMKMNSDFSVLFFRGVMCNILVCLAVLCSLKMKSESGKLIMIWWCLFAFVTAGFEHSIANMTVFITSLLAGPIDGVSVGGMFYNLVATTSGNIVGGILLAIAYFYASPRVNN